MLVGSGAGVITLLTAWVVASRSQVEPTLQVPATRTAESEGSSADEQVTSLRATDRHAVVAVAEQGEPAPAQPDEGGSAADDYVDSRLRSIEKMYAQFAAGDSGEGIGAFYAGLAVAFLAAAIDMDSRGEFQAFTPGEHIRPPRLPSTGHFSFSFGSRQYLVDPAEYPVLARLRTARKSSVSMAPTSRDPHGVLQVGDPTDLSAEDRADIHKLYVQAIERLAVPR